MDWVLKNLENVIIPIVILILYGLGSASQKKDKKRKEEAGSQSTPATVDLGEARRVEQIQEEIRRKIVERTGRVPPPPPKPVNPARSVGQKVMPRDQRHPVVQSPQRDRAVHARRPALSAATPPPFRQDLYEKEIEAKMRKVRELEAQLKRKPASDVWDIKSGHLVPKGELRTQLFRDLANPLGQKKAILVGEILGSPVGIKGPAGWKAHF